MSTPAKHKIIWSDLGGVEHTEVVTGEGTAIIVRNVYRARGFEARVESVGGTPVESHDWDHLEALDGNGVREGSESSPVTTGRTDGNGNLWSDRERLVPAKDTADLVEVVRSENLIELERLQRTEDLTKLGIVPLRKLGASLKIKGAYRMNTADLLAAIPAARAGN